MTEQITVYRCPTHGLVENTISAFALEGGERWQECPVSEGWEDVCHQRMEGPLQVILGLSPTQIDAALAVMYADQPASTQAKEPA
jgi:hypothetical protein